MKDKSIDDMFPSSNDILVFPVCNINMDKDQRMTYMPINNYVWIHNSGISHIDFSSTGAYAWDSSISKV